MAAGCHPGPVTPSADLSPPRRPIFFPVVIATVFLTIIAMAGGYVLGERQRNDDRASGGGVLPSEQPGQPTAAFTPPGPWCPDPTRDKAERTGHSSELWEVLKIQFNGDNLIWICQDRTGGLYYQSFTGDEGEPLVEGKNGLFLADVRAIGPDRYQAFDKYRNEFVISPDEFTLDYVDEAKKDQINKAERVD
jgi:hypothetical protein